MFGTLVVQSHRDPLPYRWLQSCLDSVVGWAQANQFAYRFVGDEIFDRVDPLLRAKTRDQIVIASDLARLKSLQQGLIEGYERVVWMDADFLVFRPADFVLPDTDFALGREVWIQPDARARLRAHVKVHNAFLMFRHGNHFLDFYCDTAERLLQLNQGRMAPQFIGPKLLSALHNIAQCPVMESAGMLSPPVLRDLIAGQGDGLNLLLRKSSAALAGANLGSSLTQSAGFSDGEMEFVIDRLLGDGLRGSS
jgi:hypothetical protein